MYSRSIAGRMGTKDARGSTANQKKQNSSRALKERSQTGSMALRSDRGSGAQGGPNGRVAAVQQDDSLK